MLTLALLHLFTHSPNYSLPLTHLLHLLTHSLYSHSLMLTRSLTLIHSFTHSLSLTHLLARFTLTHLLTFTHSLIYSLNYSDSLNLLLLTYSLTYSIYLYSLTHPHSFIHSLSLTHWFTYSHSLTHLGCLFFIYCLESKKKVWRYVFFLTNYTFFGKIAGVKGSKHFREKIKNLTVVDYFP